jgi:phage terminase large subunit-like protein
MKNPSESLETAHDVCTGYVASVLSGEITAGAWVFAAAKRWERDAQREDIYMDWEEVEKLRAFVASLDLLHEWSRSKFALHPWQLWVAANLYGWRWTADGARRTKLAIVQVGRGNGKTTMMAALGLYDLTLGEGRRVHALANGERQAMLTVSSARQMVITMPDDNQWDLEVRTNPDRVLRKTADCEFTALPAMEKNLDGLNPSLWIADEAAEFRGRFLTKLLTTGAKRKETLGVIISTPGDNPDNLFAEMIGMGHAVLKGEAEDDSAFYALYGIDGSDTPEDEGCWAKANPGMALGQPDHTSVRRAWATMRRTPQGRNEFVRYHLARQTEGSGAWLDMQLWSGTESEIPDGGAVWIGLDLSKSLDMSALMVAWPSPDGSVHLQGHYWWPSADVAQRELDYRLPIRRWAAEHKLNLTPGREVDYEAIRDRVNELGKRYDIRAIAYDAWGSKYLAEVLQRDGFPIVEYSMGIATFARGAQLFQNLWAGQKLACASDHVLRASAREAVAQRDRNGNVRPIKSRETCILDPLVASIMAVHAWGGKAASCYEE